MGPIRGANRLVWRRVPADAVRLLGMAGLALGLIALSAIAAQAGGDESPSYQIDTSHSGGQPADGLRAPLGQVWSRDLGGAVSYALIEDGRAYVTVADTGTNGTRLFALDLATGAIDWGPIELGGFYNFSGAAYDGGRIFAVNFQGLLTAYDAITGAQVWSAQLTGQSSFTTQPAAYQGIVYLSGAGSGGTLYAVSEANGHVLWTAPVLNGDHSIPAVTADGVYVSYACDQAYDFNPTTGALIWHHSSNCEGGGGKTVALYGGRVYTRDFNSGNLILDAQTGAQVGTFPFTVPYGFTIPIPAFSGSMGYFFDSSQLRGIDLGTGTTLWTFAGDGRLSSAPIVVGTFVYIGSTSGNVYALDSSSGALVGTINVGSGISFPDEADAAQLAGLSAGEGYVLAPAGNRLVALTSAIRLTPSSLTFPSQLVGTTSQAEVVTVTNFSASAVNVSAISVSGDFARSTNCPASLPAGTSCTVQVTFSPTASGPLTGPLSVRVGVYPTPQTALLSGIGVDAVLDHITVSPAQATIIAGAGQAFSVEGFNSAGNDLGDLTGSASFSIQDATGSCAGATCTDTVAGGHTVVAVVGGKPATALLTVTPGPADHITISPSSATITAGGSQSYTDRAFDAYGNDLGDVTQQSVFTLITPSYASPLPCPNATCSTIYATQPLYGDSVQASYTPSGGGQLTSLSPLAVVPGPIDHLVISPTNDTIAAGVPVGYYLYSADVYGNRIADISGSAQFTITSPGTCNRFNCSSRTSGNYVVNATYSGRSISANLTVVPDFPTTLVVSPATATAAAGSGQVYSDQAYDEYGNSFGNETSASTFTAQNGACTANICTSTMATPAGTYDTVTASWKWSQYFSALTGTAQLTIVPGPAHSLALTGPASTTAGAAVTITARAADTYGNDIGDVSGQASFSIAPDGSCQVNSCAPTKAGAHTITATYQGASGTLGLVVTAGPVASLQLAPANATITVGGSQAYTAEGFDQYGNDVGDVTPATTFTLAGSSCSGNLCTPTNASASGLEVNGTYQSAGGRTFLVVLRVAVTVDQVSAAPQSSNKSIQFSDTIRVSARVTLASACCGAAGGTVTFSTGTVAVTVPISLPAGTTSAVVSADYPMSAIAVPGGAGPYTLTAAYQSFSVNYGGATGAATVTVLREAASTTFATPYYVSDGSGPTLAVTVDQRDPAGDTQYIDYAVTSVWVRFDVFTPGAATPSRTVYAQMRDASSWSTTGLGTAQITLSTPLPDGVYEVVAGIVASSTSPNGNSSSYLAADLLRVYITSAPTTSNFAAGAGFVNPDSASNTGTRNGYFGLFLKPGKTPQGTIAYTYRVSMDVGGGSIRDVDVEVTGTSIGSLNIHSGGGGGTVAAAGRFSVRYLDAVTGIDYSAFDFTGGSYQLNATDGGATGDKYQIVLMRPDGTAFHSSSSGQVLIAGGGITVKS
ncbi:MAG: choice-of-anchor D domain-containing protein [Chloroflexi bacterium]|nr:MAG: choice-of-anchor D domain-containing protein [Chloroflexota bacterium]